MSTNENEGDPMILRDHLAIDRTKLANQRTLLSFIRTSLMLVASGVTIMKLVPPEDALFYVGLATLFGAMIVFALGMYNYNKITKRISACYIKTDLERITSTN